LLYAVFRKKANQLSVWKSQIWWEHNLAVCRKYMEILHAFTVPTVLHIKTKWSPVHFSLYCVLSNTKGRVLQQVLEVPQLVNKVTAPCGTRRFSTMQIHVFWDVTESCYIYERFECPYCRHPQAQTLLETFLRQHCWDKFKSGVTYRAQIIFQVVHILKKRNPIHTVLSYVKYSF